MMRHGGVGGSMLSEVWGCELDYKSNWLLVLPQPVAKDMDTIKTDLLSEHGRDGPKI